MKREPNNVYMNKRKPYSHRNDLDQNPYNDMYIRNPYNKKDVNTDKNEKIGKYNKNKYMKFDNKYTDTYKSP